VFGVLSGHEHDPGPSALAFRLMGAVHRLVLSGKAPPLASHYPSTGGEPRDAWPAFLELLRERRDELRALIDHPVQTNEPARCAALLGGFLEVARTTGLPLRCACWRSVQAPDSTCASTATATSWEMRAGARRSPQS